MEHTSRSSGLLGVKASLNRVYQSDLKTSGVVTTGGACGTITEVASEAS
jgi:preprotein translocase subunit YajC